MAYQIIEAAPKLLMRRQKPMSTSRARLLLIGLLSPQCGAPLPVAIQPIRGQGFVYRGQSHTQISGPLAWDLNTPFEIMALVTRAATSRGYTVLLIGSASGGVKPPNGARASVRGEDAETVQYGPNLEIAAAGSALSPMAGAMLQYLPVPFIPPAKLRVGSHWRQPEPIPLLYTRSLPVRYSVAGEATMAGRKCLKVQKRLVQPLPFRETFTMTHELTDYRQNLCVDAASGVVYIIETQARMHHSFVDLQGIEEIRVTARLESTRQLTPRELAAREREARRIVRTRRALDPDLQAATRRPRRRRPKRK